MTISRPANDDRRAPYDRRRIRELLKKPVPAKTVQMGDPSRPINPHAPEQQLGEPTPNGK